ncbi:MAG: arginine--tRNA ligase [Lawsonibacter sp.]|jgi:arginyl-tRNA synthetase|nr:arginine--tRNA ligase [Lawsonibacter sp.]MCI9268030.1 arginine--tRNA ligase [Lawsonibacter sp.]
MSNMIQSAMDQVAALTRAAYEKAFAAGVLPAGGEMVTVTIEIPRDTSHGDYASNFAMAGARELHMAPRAIAQAIVDHLELEGSYFQKAEIAGPGFLNFTLGPKWYGEVLRAIEEEGPDYGSGDRGAGKRVMVEFVSANPTGPMHMGNARGGVLGDTLANVLARNGWNVWREFYVNDAGNQIDKFARSIYARYMQIVLGEDAVPFPEDGYQGEDIKELAQAFYEASGSDYKNEPEEDALFAMAQFGLERNIPKMKEDLNKYGIEYDQWFLESSLHNSGAVAGTVQLLTDKGWTYEKDGALWLNTTELLKKKYLAEGKTQEQVDKLDLKDDVLRRANGFYTYFAADIAYHRNKLEERKFDLAINIWGADHHGHVARLQAALDGLGLDGSHRLVIVLMQLVNLLQDGKPVRMSKRTGKAIALHDLLDEISVDAARYYFNNRTPSSPLDFDLDLAVRQDSENPVYLVQYAHGRICSLITRMAEDEGAVVPAAAEVDMTLLTHEKELALLKALAQYPEELYLAARDYDPSRINRYLTALAEAFHRFYNEDECRLMGAEPAVRSARLKLADSVRAVLANGLNLLGVTAPRWSANPKKGD